MAQKFLIRTTGVSATIQNLQKRRNRLQQINRPINATMILWFQWIQRNFKSEGAPVGGWKSLDAQTITRRARRRRGKKGGFQILAETGRLRQTWAFLTPRRNTGILKSFTRYSRIHNEGGTGSMGQRIPKRQILPPKIEELKMAKKAFRNFVKRAI